MPPFQIKLSQSPSVKRRIKRYPKTYGTMPPSFMVDKYQVKIHDVKYQELTSKGYKVYGYVTIGELNLRINKELHDHVVYGWKKQSPKLWKDYTYWPPRCSIVERSVVENDVGLKLLKWVDYREALMKLRFKGCLDIAYAWVDNVKQNLSEGDHVKKYVSDHAESHPTPGYTWNQLLKAGLMRKLFNFTSQVVDEWERNFYEPGDWCIDSESFNIGMRARSPDDLTFNYYMPFKLERGRQIGYCPGPSSANAFVPHDRSISFMRKLFDEYESKLGFKIYCPKIDGGRVYTLIRDAFLEGKKIMHYDVSGMELITPSIINGDVRAFPKGIGMTIGRRGNMPELLSGVAPTSDFDMMAHLELISRLMLKRPLFIVILGDDATWVEGSVLSSPLYERQIQDDRTMRTLGLTCNEYMHPIGRNVTIDTANKRINLEKSERDIENKMDFSDRMDIADYFLGNVRGVPLHEIIGKVKPEEGKYSPREMIESAVQISATT
jgi:hypothetical protein